jgi:hypothetical protein
VKAFKEADFKLKDDKIEEPDMYLGAGNLENVIR